MVTKARKGWTESRLSADSPSTKDFGVFPNYNPYYDVPNE
jgi:hypothetical protein